MRGSSEDVKQPYLIVPLVYTLGLRMPDWRRVRLGSTPVVGAESRSAEDPAPGASPVVEDPTLVDRWLDGGSMGAENPKPPEPGAAIAVSAAAPVGRMWRRRCSLPPYAGDKVAAGGDVGGASSPGEESCGGDDPEANSPGAGTPDSCASHHEVDLPRVHQYLLNKIFLNKVISDISWIISHIVS